MTDLFEQFWGVYPNKKGKGAARKAWEKATAGNDESAMLTDVLLALEAQKRYRIEAKSLGEFIPEWKHPSTWLNQECWLDEIGSHAELKQRHELQTCKHCSEPVHGPRFDVCSHHLEFTPDGRLNGVLMADELRAYYNQNPEIKTMNHHQAALWMKQKIRGIGQ